MRGVHRLTPWIFVIACGGSPRPEPPTTPDAADPAGSAYACAMRPPDFDSCLTTADCDKVALGCYCGGQPVIGVATKYFATASACFDYDMAHCDLGCANQPGLMAQDQKATSSFDAIAVRCDAALRACRTYIP